MNLKIILFFSIIMLIFSVGSASSADVVHMDHSDSSVLIDESFYDDSVSDDMRSEINDVERSKMELPRDFNKELVEINEDANDYDSFISDDEDLNDHDSLISDEGANDYDSFISDDGDLNDFCLF